LGAILDDGERLAELVEVREGADDVVKELDAAPRHMLGGHEQTFLLRPARLQNVHQRSRARRSLTTPPGDASGFAERSQVSSASAGISAPSRAASCACPGGCFGEPGHVGTGTRRSKDRGGGRAESDWIVVTRHPRRGASLRREAALRAGS